MTGAKVADTQGARVSCFGLRGKQWQVCVSQSFGSSASSCFPQALVSVGTSTVTSQEHPLTPPLASGEGER